jgi:hypothetical protein
LKVGLLALWHLVQVTESGITNPACLLISGSVMTDESE